MEPDFGPVALAGEGENLCLAGGMFLNVMLVEFLERCGKWKNVFVQPAAGNAGTALGAVSVRSMDGIEETVKFPLPSTPA